MTQPADPASTPPDIFCYGAVEVVNRVQLPHMPAPHRPSPVTADYYRAGGSALNVALPLAVWGLHPAIAGNELGEDAYADLILSELARHPGVDARWLHRSEQARTPFTRIFVLPDHERYAVQYWHDQVRWRQLDAQMLAGAAYLSTDADLGDAAASAAKLARTLDIPVVSTDVVDAEHPLAPLSDIIITSLTHLTGVFETVDLPDLTARLHDAGAGVIIVTNGSDPIQLFSAGTRPQSFPSFPLPPVDRTGTGDIFKAGCLYGLVQGWEWARIIRFAAATAALWIVQPTMLKQPPHLAQIEALLAERAPRLLIGNTELSDEQRPCPLCQRPVDAVLFEKHWQMTPATIEAVRRSYPGWRRTDGACPQCIHEHRAIAERLQYPGIPLLLEGHPIYGKPDLFVLPTPVRLRANPHYSGRNITVAFLDSGFYPHPDLTEPASRIIEMVDATDDDIVIGADFREPRPVSWHGMMTSVAAVGNGALSNGRYAGIASDARVVLVKISDPRGRVRERDITRGLRWLLAHHRRYGIDIVNISVGGDRSGLDRHSVIDALVGRLVGEGVVVVAAAGNAGQSDLVPPASAEAAITVGGIDDRNVLDRRRRRMYGSNWGRMASGALKPEVVAPSIWLAAPVLPGTHIAEQNLILDRLWRAEDDALPALLDSTYRALGFSRAVVHQARSEQRRHIRQKMLENKFVTPFYQHVDGTSFAAPIISSVVAQMLEVNPALAPAQVKSLIVATAERLAHEPEERQGYGVITPGRAVAAALRLRYGALDEAPLSPHFDDAGVHFLFYDERAQAVSVVGDFNDWRPHVHLMQSTAPGRWSLLIPRPAPGRYHYKFLIDGERWIDDPENGEKEPDGYGGFNAILLVD